MDRRSFLAGVALAPTWASLGLPALGAELDPGQRQHLDTELDTELDAWLGAQGRRAEQVSQRLGARLAGAEAAGMDPSLLAQVTTAWASGWVEPLSAPAIRDAASSGSPSGPGSQSVTCGRPSVMVPVLSKSTTVRRCAVSRASAFLNNTP